MKDDIKSRKSRRVGRPKGPATVRKSIDFYIPESEALAQFRDELTTNPKKPPSYRSILIDGVVKGQPRFRAILKQKQEAYDKTQSRRKRTILSQEGFQARAIEQEFN